MINVEDSQEKELKKLKNDLSNEYEILDVIGVNSVGYVLKVTNKLANRTEVLKVLNDKEIEVNSNAIARFNKEALTLIELKNKFSNLCIPRIYSFKEGANFIYYSMEYIEGITLSEAIDTKHFSYHESLNIVCELANILHIIHSNDIIHRDIKPSNIILSNKKKPWLIDFGILKKVNETEKITKRGARLGTANYMSPEQIIGQNISFLSDIYSLGVVFYEMLTFKPYIKDKSCAAAFYNIVYREMLSPREENPEIDEKIEEICLKALNKNPTKRYQNALEMKNSILKYLQH